MRIDIHKIIAVLSLAAFWFPCMSSVADFAHIGQKPKKSSNRRDSKIFAWSTGGERMEEEMDRPWLSHRDQQIVVRERGGESSTLECCPSRLEMVEPVGGKNQDGMYVELYRDGENRQRFYELSCREDVDMKPCRFVERKLLNQSRCVQQYSYSYALVLDTAATEEGKARHHHHDKSGISYKEWKMDYIKVRSGCSCEIMPKIKKKKNNARNKKNHRSKKMRLEADQT